jgi:hypothetical protein
VVAASINTDSLGNVIQNGQTDRSQQILILPNYMENSSSCQNTKAGGGWVKSRCSSPAKSGQPIQSKDEPKNKTRKQNQKDSKNKW